MSCEAKVISETITPLSNDTNETTVRTIIDCKFCPRHYTFDKTGNMDTVFCEAAEAVSNYLPEGCTPPKKLIQ